MALWIVSYSKIDALFTRHVIGPPNAVEAASRVLTDSSPARVSLLVDRIVNHCFIDGQLDNCELTFKDIREIRSNFVFLLTSMYHRRIQYPGFEIEHEGTHTEPAKAPAT